MAFLCLDRNLRVDLCGGSLAQCGIDVVDASKPITEQIDALVGLMPTLNQPVVIENTQTAADQFIDIHLFYAAESQWVVLFNNTKAGHELQIRQQVLLSNDIINEQGK